VPNQILVQEIERKRTELIYHRGRFRSSQRRLYRGANRLSARVIVGAGNRLGPKAVTDSDAKPLPKLPFRFCHIPQIRQNSTPSGQMGAQHDSMISYSYENQNGAKRLPRLGSRVRISSPAPVWSSNIMAFRSALRGISCLECVEKTTIQSNSTKMTERSGRESVAFDAVMPERTAIRPSYSPTCSAIPENRTVTAATV
jgi:hypothetical protein